MSGESLHSLRRMPCHTTCMCSPCLGVVSLAHNEPFNSAKLVITTTYASPLAVASTYALEKATRAKFGFPFYNPKPSFNSRKFPGLPEGKFSFWAWQGSRVLAWYAISKLAVGLLATSYAISVYSANSGSDNRLEDYRREIARRTSAAMRNTQQRPMSQGSPGQPYQQYSQQKWEESTSAPEPAGWASSEQTEKVAPTSSPSKPWTATQNPQTGRQDSYNQDSYVFDDASPVAPSEQTNSSPQNSSQQSGSAWDRIRGQAQAARNQPGSWAKKRQDEMTSRGSQDGTSYNYSTADEEKSYAKDQAQKEFDDMLERERRGQGR